MMPIIKLLFGWLSPPLPAGTVVLQNGVVIHVSSNGTTSVDNTVDDILEAYKK